MASSLFPGLAIRLPAVNDWAREKADGLKGGLLERGRQLNPVRERIIGLMEESQSAQPVIGRIEAMIRRFWARLGAALDSMLGARSSERVDVSAVIPAVEREIESRLRKEAGQLIAPNLIDVRLAYETYSRMGSIERDFLRRELRSSIAEFVHNRRYKLASDLIIDLGFDPLKRRLVVTAKFPDEVRNGKSSSRPADARRGIVTCKISLLSSSVRQPGVLHASLSCGDAAVGLGRSHDNVLVIGDNSVSNFHGSFTIAADGALWLSDVGSSNGTWVNGALVGANNRIEVHDGDRLRFGDVEATLHLSLDQASPA